MNIKDCQYISLPKLADERGVLSFVENNHQIPFEIKRVFYLYDVPAGKMRGAHAHKVSQQFILSLSGNITLELDDGRSKQHFQLSDPWRGVYIPSMIWTTLYDFQPGTICLVLASDFYDETDYYRTYKDFLYALEHVT